MTSKSLNDLNILMVIPSFYPIVGGAERQLMGLSNKLSQKGLNIDVVTRKISTIVPDDDESYKVFRLGAKIPKLSFLLNLFFFILKNRKKYKIIHVHTLNSPAIVCSLLGNILDLKVILKVTRSGKDTQLSRYRKSIIGRLFFSILSKGTFVAITEEINNELISMGIDKKNIIEIPNGVNLPKISKTDNGFIQIIYVGRLIKRKRVDLLLEAIMSIKSINQFRLFIIGSGVEKTYLENIIRVHSLEKSCTFEGELDHFKVAELMSSSDIFVLPSDSEGMSNSLLEAMSSFNTVIASNISANKQLIIQNKNGLLFNDKEELATLLALAIDNSAMRDKLAQEARATIERSYSFSSVSNKYISLYKELIMI